MAAQDLFNNVKLITALYPRTIATDTTTAGAIIDTKGFNSVLFGVQTGTLANSDGDYTVLIEDGDDSGLSDAAAVADTYLLGTESGASFTADTDDAKLSKVGYIGNKRYVRLSIVSTNTTNGQVIGALCALGHPQDAPQSTQVV